MAFYTDKHLLTHFPELEPLDRHELVRTARDAGLIYDYAHTRPGIEEASLRAWGERHEITPDRMNLALMLLQRTGKLLVLPEGGPLTPASSALRPKARARARKTPTSRKETAE